MTFSFPSIALVLWIATAPTKSDAQESPPGRLLASALDVKMHILEPVAITDEKHATIDIDPVPITIGDKVLIRVTCERTQASVNRVDVRFANKAMAACEITKLVSPPVKDKKELADFFG